MCGHTPHGLNDTSLSPPLPFVCFLSILKTHSSLSCSVFFGRHRGSNDGLIRKGENIGRHHTKGCAMSVSSTHAFPCNCGTTGVLVGGLDMWFCKPNERGVNGGEKWETKHSNTWRTFTSLSCFLFPFIEWVFCNLTFYFLFPNLNIIAFNMASEYGANGMFCFSQINFFVTCEQQKS